MARTELKTISMHRAELALEYRSKVGRPVGKRPWGVNVVGGALAKDLCKQGNSQCCGVLVWSNDLNNVGAVL